MRDMMYRMIVGGELKKRGVFVMEDRRRDNRRELISNIIIKKIGETSESDVRIHILDVSKSGVGFTCAVPLEIGTVYEAHLRIWTQEVLHAFLEIVRIEKNSDHYSYGAIFIGMPAMDVARIETYDTMESMHGN